MRVIMLLSIILVLFLSACSNNTQNDVFAQCLTDNGAEMYGTFWCSHCTRTKQNFGTSFKYINYHECDARGTNEEAQLCKDENIEGYPTWEFADGSRIPGAISFETLSQKTGCELPTSD